MIAFIKRHKVLTAIVGIALLALIVLQHIPTGGGNTSTNTAPSTSTWQTTWYNSYRSGTVVEYQQPATFQGQPTVRSPNLAIANGFDPSAQVNQPGDVGQLVCSYHNATNSWHVYIDSNYGYETVTAQAECNQIASMFNG